MAGQKNLVIWLEDQPLSVGGEILQLQAAGFEIMCIATVFELLDILKDRLSEVVAIITEFILPKVLDLSALGVQESDTSDGLYAGIILLDMFLRSKKSPYGKIPVLIFSKAWREDVDWYRNRLKIFGPDRKHGPIKGLAKGPGYTEGFAGAFRETIMPYVKNEDIVIPSLGALEKIALIDLRGKTVDKVMEILRDMGFEVSETDITDLYKNRDFSSLVLKKVTCVWLSKIQERMPSFILWSGKVITPSASDDLHLFIFRGKQMWGMNRTCYLMA